MNFTKRTTFSDQLDEDIYIFRMMLDLTERGLGKNIDTFKDMLGGRITINAVIFNNAPSVNDKYYFCTTFIHPVYGNCDISEGGGIVHLDVMNLWLHNRTAIVRDPESRHYGTFSLTDGTDYPELEESDERLDACLQGGVNNTTEEIYFQESLLRTDHMFEFEDYDRLIDALNTESTLSSSFYHQRIPGWNYTHYEAVYDYVMGVINESK